VRTVSRRIDPRLPGMTNGDHSVVHLAYRTHHHSHSGSGSLGGTGLIVVLGVIVVTLLVVYAVKRSGGA
jgi:hypothetical protein